MQIRKRTPDIAGNDAEQCLRGGREEADIEAGVEEDRRDVGAVQHVLQIVGGRALPFQRLLKLTVEGGELLVERLQLLFRRQQLLVRRLEFLIDGQRFLVDRLLLLAGSLQVPDGVLQFRPRGFEFPFKVGHTWPSPRAGGVASPRLLLRFVNKADQQQVLALARDGLYIDPEGVRAAVAAAVRDGHNNARVVLTGALQRRPDPGAHVWTHHGEQIMGGKPRRHAQIAFGRPQEVQALVLAVDQYRRRRIGLDHQTLA